MTLFKRRQRAFTLIELVVVVAILAVTATLVLARVQGVESEARFAVTLSNYARTTQAIEAYNVRSKNHYPDGWDSLIVDRAGTPAIYSGNGDPLVNTGVYTGSDPWLVADAITASELFTLVRVSDNIVASGPGGVLVTVYDHDATASDANLSTYGATEVQVDSTTNNILAFVNDPNTSAAGAEVYDSFGVPYPNATTPQYRLVAFGLGPNTSIVGDSQSGILEAPTINAAAPGWDRAYRRPIALFKVFNPTSSAERPFAEFVGIVNCYGQNQAALRQFAP